MAYDPTLPAITTPGSRPKGTSPVTRTLEYDFGVFEIEEFNMDTVWPAGDPCARDKETLVIFRKRTYRMV